MMLWVFFLLCASTDLYVSVISLSEFTGFRILPTEDQNSYLQEDEELLQSNISFFILVLIQANLSSCHDAMDTLFILTHYVLVPSYIRFICH